MTLDSQLKILVKKTDGTSVRMTLDEFKKMKMSSSTQILGPLGGNSQVNTINKKEKEDAELKRKADEIRQKLREDIAKSAIANKEELLPSKANKWESEDHKSLLDDEFHSDVPVLVKEGEHILARSAPVSNMFENVARYSEKKVENNEMPVKSEIGKQKFDKPKSIKNIILSSNDFIMPKTRQASPRSAMPGPAPLSPKPIMSDIKSLKVTKQSVSPIDEIRQFTLEDFRRLGGNSVESAMKLREKFKYLEADSYLIFMEGVEAWYNSPIYKQYQAVIAKSLKTKSTIGNILSGVLQPTDLKLTEFKEILKFNQSLY